MASLDGQNIKRPDQVSMECFIMPMETTDRPRRYLQRKSLRDAPPLPDRHKALPTLPSQNVGYVRNSSEEDLHFSTGRKGSTVPATKTHPYEPQAILCETNIGPDTQEMSLRNDRELERKNPDNSEPAEKSKRFNPLSKVAGGAVKIATAVASLGDSEQPSTSIVDRHAMNRSIEDRKQLKRQVHELQKDLKYAHEDKRDLREAFDKLRAEKDKLDSHREVLEAENLSLQHQLWDARGTADKATSSLNQANSALESKALFLDQQLQDSEIVGKFEQLLSDIRTWSVDFIKGKGLLAHGNFSHENLQQYFDVLPACTSVKQLVGTTQEKTKRRLFVRGWVAYVMVHRLIRSTQANKPMSAMAKDHWLDAQAADALAELEGRIFEGAPSSKQYSEWRAMTIELLSKICSPTGKMDSASHAINEAVEAVMVVCTPWAEPSEIDRLRIELRDIYIRAVYFSLLIRAQRPWWIVDMLRARKVDQVQIDPADAKFDAEKMAVDSRSDEVDLKAKTPPALEIIISPLLGKKGSLNGDKFDVMSTLVKAVVAVKAT